MEAAGKPRIVVAGGGLTGASFALAVAAPDCPVLVLEASPATAQAGGFDSRSTALSWGSREILEQLGVWRELDPAPCPIDRIEVSDQGHPGGVCFDSREQGLEALGYVVENHQLGGALLAALKQSEHVELLAPAELAAARPIAEGIELTVRQHGGERRLTAALAVIADGGRSPIPAKLGIERRTKPHDQYALVANIALGQPHRNRAWERFTAHGPLAVLPLPKAQGVHRASLVWTLPEHLARENLELAEKRLLARLQADFGPGMGQVTGIGRRACFPLQLSWVSEQIRPGLALIGNAAHMLHPVAGQGFNLALRDCASLARVVGKAVARCQSPGDMAVLQQYLDEQEFDQDKTILFTELLVGLFSGNSAAKAMFRRLGLLALDVLPPVRRRFASNAMGLGLF